MEKIKLFLIGCGVMLLSLLVAGIFSAFGAWLYLTIGGLWAITIIGLLGVITLGIVFAFME